MLAHHIAAFLFILTLTDLTAGWRRYERRILSCSNVNATSCTMEIGRNVTQTVECRHEPIPDVERTKLNSNATYRVACPVGCKIHIVQQAHSLNRKCLSFSTFGKYFDADAKNWYIWFCEPCQAVFSTNCEFES
nr:Protein C10F3.7 [Haemonchus contortus]